VRLLIPTTYMNRSGPADAALARFFRIEPDAILVAHDALDMTPGVARLIKGGGHGRHTLLRDIIAQPGATHRLHRLRPDTARLGHASLGSGYVLSRAPRSEQELLDRSIDNALEVVPEILAGDWTKAMQTLHSKKA